MRAAARFYRVPILFLWSSFEYFIIKTLKDIAEVEKLCLWPWH